MKELICIVCPRGCHMSADETSGSVTGNFCKRGETYAHTELYRPMRTLTATVRLDGAHIRRAPCKTVIPKEAIPDVMDRLRGVTINAPVKLGDTILELPEYNTKVIITRTIEKSC